MRRILILFLLVISGVASSQTKIDLSTQARGTLPATSMPTPTASTLGGVQSVDCTGSGHIVKIDTSGVATCAADASGGIPSGMVAFLLSGTCPSGWTQQALAGNYLLLTVALNGDVGTTGGSLTVPAETVNSLTAAAQTFTGDTTTVPAETVNSLTAAAQTVNSLTAAAQTISGSTATEAAHTHSVTSNVSGTLTPGGTIAWPASVPTFAGTAGTVPAETVNSLTAAAQTITWPVNVPAFSGSSTTVPALGVGTLAGPAHTHTITQSSITTTKFTTSSSGTAAYTGGGIVTTPSGGASSTTITGSTATGTLTPLGTVAWPANPPTNGTSAVTGTLNSTSFTPAGTVAWPTGGTSLPVFTGTTNQALTMTNNAVTSGAGSSHSHGVGTLANTASAVTGTMNSSAVTGTLNSTTITPLGHNASSAVTGTLNSTTIQPTFVKVIACQKN